MFTRYSHTTLMTFCILVLLMISGCVPYPAEMNSMSGSSGSSDTAVEEVSTHAPLGDVQVVEGASARLTRTADGVMMNFNTAELEPGNVYTAWWVFINNPAECATIPCTPSDVLGNSEVVVSDLGYADGLIADENGMGNFSAYQPLGELANAWIGNGFSNAEGAEVHLHLNDHGPVIPELIDNMLSSYRGGCTDESIPPPFPDTAKADGTPGPNSCQLFQFAIFVPDEIQAQAESASESATQDETADDELPVAYSGEFARVPIDLVMPTGQSVAVECQDADADYPYAPYDWPEAAATLEIRQGAGVSTVAIEVSGAKPDTYYTMWLRLGGQDVNGVAYGGNPLMAIPGTPLIPSTHLMEALDTVSEPNDTSINGFHSDENGDASFSIELDFPIINGAYPYYKFEGFDATDERFNRDEPAIPPVAIAMTGAPFTLRVASHCTDGLGHGLLPGPHEGWFDWKME